MSLLEQIGLEPKLLLAQAVNFALIVFILYYFLHKPLGGMIEERRQKIEAGLKKHEEAEALMGRIQALRQEIIAQATEEKENLLAEAKLKIEQIEEEARVRSSAFEQSEREKIEKELVALRSGFYQSLESAFPDLFLLLAAKVFKRKDSLNKDFIERVLSES